MPSNSSSVVMTGIHSGRLSAIASTLVEVGWKYRSSPKKEAFMIFSKEVSTISGEAAS